MQAVVNESSAPQPSPGRILAPLIMTALLLAIIGIHLWLNPRFFYWDDMQHAIMPVIRTIGLRLSDGDWPAVTLLSWQSGNMVGEGQYQLFNPISLALFPLVASFDDMSIGAAVYSVAYLLIAAAGAYFLSWRAGADPYFSAAAGLAYATSPFLLYWLAGSWTNGLASMAFLPWAVGCVAGRRMTAWAAVGAFAASYCLAVSGWIHGLFALALFCALRLWDRRKSWSPAEIGVAVLTVCGGMLTAGPQLVATLDAVRAGTRMSSISNLGILTTEPQALLAGSMLPAYFGKLNWGAPGDLLAGGTWPVPPIVYCAWFLIPAVIIAFHARRELVAGSWLLLGALVLGILMLGPDQLGPMRWPLRFMPAFCLGVTTWAVMQLSSKRASEPSTVLQSTALIAIASFLSWQQAPGSWLEIGLWAIFIGLACYATTVSIVIGRKSRERIDSGLIALFMTGLVAVGFAGLWPRNGNLPTWHGASFASELAQPGPHGAGSTLQVYAYSTEPDGLPTAERIRQLPSGNMPMLSGRRHVNGYSPVEPAGLSRYLCSNTFGWTCGMLMPGLFRAEPETGAALMDLMRIDTVKVDRSRDQARLWLDREPGWVASDRTDEVTTYSRREPSRLPGTLSYLSDGIRHLDVERMTDDVETHHLAIDAGAASRLVVFARAWYPGYVASWNGDPLEVISLAKVLAAVRIPPGVPEGRLEIRYSVFYNPFSVLTLLAGMLLLTGSLVLVRHAVRERQDGPGT